MRIVVLGGSGVATPGLVQALAPHAGRHPGMELVLHGRSLEKLVRVAAVCRTLAAGTGMSVSAEPDLATALKGAEVVFNQIRAGGLEGRAFDEQFPTRLGLIGEETIGAGGFANALRTIPAVVALAQAVEQHSPGALFLNFSNPSSLVQQAIHRTTGLKAFSVCDLPVTMTEWVEQALGYAPGNAPSGLEVEYFGTNHLGWVHAVREDGRDRLPQVLDGLHRIPRFPLDPGFVRRLGLLPCSYLKYYLHQRRFLPTAPCSHSRANELQAVEAELLTAYGEGDPQRVQTLLGRRNPHWYREVVVPTIAAWTGAAGARLVLQVPTAGRVPQVGFHSVVELPCRVAAGRVEPLWGIAGSGPLDRLPPDCRARFLQNAAYEELAVTAILTSDRDLARRALAANPLVGSIEAADAVLQECWRLLQTPERT